MNECNAEGSTTYALVLRCKIENNPQLIIVCITLYYSILSNLGFTMVCRQCESHCESRNKDW